jgi:hypothetical protein
MAIEITKLQYERIQLAVATEFVIERVQFNEGGEAGHRELNSEKKK